MDEDHRDAAYNTGNAAGDSFPAAKSRRAQDSTWRAALKNLSPRRSFGRRGTKQNQKPPLSLLQFRVTSKASLLDDDDTTSRAPWRRFDPRALLEQSRRHRHSSARNSLQDPPLITADEATPTALLSFLMNRRLQTKLPQPPSRRPGFVRRSMSSAEMSDGPHLPSVPGEQELYDLAKVEGIPDHILQTWVEEGLRCWLSFRFDLPEFLAKQDGGHSRTSEETSRADYKHYRTSVFSHPDLQAVITDENRQLSQIDSTDDVCCSAREAPQKHSVDFSSNVPVSQPPRGIPATHEPVQRSPKLRVVYKREATRTGEWRFPGFLDVLTPGFTGSSKQRRLWKRFSSRMIHPDNNPKDNNPKDNNPKDNNPKDNNINFPNDAKREARVILENCDGDGSRNALVSFDVFSQRHNIQSSVAPLRTTTEDAPPTYISTQRSSHTTDGVTPQESQECVLHSPHTALPERGFVDQVFSESSGLSTIIQGSEEDTHCLPSQHPLQHFCHSREHSKSLPSSKPFCSESKDSLRTNIANPERSTWEPPKDGNKSFNSTSRLNRCESKASQDSQLRISYYSPPRRIVADARKSASQISMVETPGKPASTHHQQNNSHGNIMCTAENLSIQNGDVKNPTVPLVVASRRAVLGLPGDSDTTGERLSPKTGNTDTPDIIRTTKPFSGSQKRLIWEGCCSCMGEKQLQKPLRLASDVSTTRNVRRIGHRRAPRDCSGLSSCCHVHSIHPTLAFDLSTDSHSLGMPIQLRNVSKQTARFADTPPLDNPCANFELGRRESQGLKESVRLCTAPINMSKSTDSTPLSTLSNWFTDGSEQPAHDINKNGNQQLKHCLRLESILRSSPANDTVVSNNLSGLNATVFNRQNSEITTQADAPGWVEKLRNSQTRGRIQSERCPRYFTLRQSSHPAEKQRTPLIDEQSPKFHISVIRKSKTSDTPRSSVCQGTQTPAILALSDDNSSEEGSISIDFLHTAPMPPTVPSPSQKTTDKRQAAYLMSRAGPFGARRWDEWGHCWVSRRYVMILLPVIGSILLVRWDANGFEASPQSIICDDTSKNESSPSAPLNKNRISPRSKGICRGNQTLAIRAKRPWASPGGLPSSENAELLMLDRLEMIQRTNDVNAIGFETIGGVAAIAFAKLAAAGPAAEETLNEDTITGPADNDAPENLSKKKGTDLKKYPEASRPLPTSLPQDSRTQATKPPVSRLKRFLLLIWRGRPSKKIAVETERNNVRKDAAPNIRNFGSTGNSYSLAEELWKNRRLSILLLHFRDKPTPLIAAFESDAECDAAIALLKLCIHFRSPSN